MDVHGRGQAESRPQRGTEPHWTLLKVQFMRWQCKLCTFVASLIGGLLKHYRLKHGHLDHGHLLPCTHLNCPCFFKTWAVLRTHLYRAHKTEETENQHDVKAFKCKICDSCFPNTKDYFQHINSHFKRLETVECVFNGCEFKTNIYGTFATHRSWSLTVKN